MPASTSQQHQYAVAGRKHNAATRAVLAIIFWSIAAVLVAVVHWAVDAASPAAGVAGKVCVIVLVSAVYILLAASRTTLDQALFAGTAWVLFDIVAEIAVTAASGRQYFGLLGSPANGGLRCVLLIAWIVAPALFIRSHE